MKKVVQDLTSGGLLGVWGKWMKHAKYIYNIQDFNPEQVLAVGYTKSKLITDAMMWFDKFSCKRSDLVITVGRDLVETVENRFKDKKVPKTVMINNWIDENEIYPLDESNEKVLAFKKKYGLGGKFVIMYALIRKMREETEGMQVITVGVSSGGFIAAILASSLKASYCLDFAGQFSLLHHWTHVDTNPFLKELYAKNFAGSKYVKSNPVNIYSKVAKELKTGNKVLFVGLPCQVAAVKNYVKNESDIENQFDETLHDLYSDVFKQYHLDADKQKIENEAAIAKAEADKQVAITNAEAEAQKTSIAADAQAEANRKLAESLSDTLIDYQKIQKWDGKLPTVSGGNALVSIDPAE